MTEESPQREIDAEAARQGRMSGRVRRILIVSTVLEVIVIAALLVYFT